MIGKTFWEDLEIDVIEYENNISSVAKTLVDHWGKDLTESDLLKLKAYASHADEPVQCAIAKYALEYYLTLSHNPGYIHSNMSTTQNRKKWWKFWIR